jgi:hypothetical protein
LSGMDVLPARVEALRSTTKRLLAGGRPAEWAPGRCTLAAGVAAPASCGAQGRTEHAGRRGHGFPCVGKSAGSLLSVERGRASG